VDVGSAPTFSGLNKEELMKYSDDPFWVRLRWVLFILFWLAWAAMLVMAVIIIVQAPRCKPPPKRLWVEEGAIYQVDTQSLPNSKDLIAQMDKLGAKSCYLPGLISENDFAMSNYDADALIKGLSEAQKGVVTDLPTMISPNNDLFVNASKERVIDSLGNFNYTNGNLSVLIGDALGDLFERGVKGFLMNDTNTDDKKMFKQSLNGIVEDKGAAIGSDIIDMEPIESSIKTPEDLTEFLQKTQSDWAFYKFSPNFDDRSPREKYEVNLLNIAMYMYRSTPILQSFDQDTMSEVSSKILMNLAELRKEAGIKLGVVNFVNSTDPNLLGFTRVRKGTPAYAIALNFGKEHSYMNFTGTPNIASEGKVLFDSEAIRLNKEEESSRRLPLDLVQVPPQEGLILKFVAKFN